MGRVEIAAFRVGSRAKEGKVGRRGGGGDGEKKAIAFLAFSLFPIIPHNLLVLSLIYINSSEHSKLFWNRLFFLGCLPSQVSYNQNSVTLM